MKIAFHTARLRVFCEPVKPTDMHTTRMLFVGFRTDEDRPMVAVTCLVWMQSPIGGPYIDWLEVASEHRRQGIGTEFRIGLNKCLRVEPYTGSGSEDGDGFIASLVRKGHVTTNRLPPVLNGEQMRILDDLLAGR